MEPSTATRILLKLVLTGFSEILFLDRENLWS